jgi:hypothetical protein
MTFAASQFPVLETWSRNSLSRVLADANVRPDSSSMT